MKLKNGLTFVAYGFLFTLLNLNLTFNGHTVNVIPNCLGWLLLFLAHDNLKPYGEDKGYLKWTALGLTVVTAVIWIIGLMDPDFSISWLSILVSIVQAVYMFMLMGILGDIAADNQSSQQNALSTLRYLNPILLAGVTLFGYMSMFLSEYFALIATAVGIVALAAAIWTAVTLFRLRREVSVQSR